MFTYQVLALDPDTLLMLTYTTIAGRPLLTSAYLRQPGGEEGRWVQGVGYEPLAVHQEPLVAPDGNAMQVASSFRWTIPDGEAGTTEIVATADTPMMYGLGTGWIGGTHSRGTPRAGGRRSRVLRVRRQAALAGCPAPLRRRHDQAALGGLHRADVRRGLEAFQERRTAEFKGD
jgi:hypothetical protein